MKIIGANQLSTNATRNDLVLAVAIDSHSSLSYFASPREKALVDFYWLEKYQIIYRVIRLKILSHSV